MPKGVKPDVLSFWGPDQNGVVQNDFLCIGRSSKNPVLAHHFLNFMLDEQNAYNNIAELRRLHAAAERDRRRDADQARPDPEEP